MSFANNLGVKIHYEVEGQGPPLVLVHGLTSSLESWRTYGYVSELKPDYQLVLIDVRGHGKSDKPDDWNAYDVKTLAADIVAVMDELNLTEAHYLGYSMGAWIGLNGIARNYISRFKSLILGGYSAYLDLKVAQFSSYSMQPLAEDDKSVSAAAPQKSVNQELASMLNRIQSMNSRALAGIQKQMVQSFSENSADLWLPKINIPCLIYAGEADLNFCGVQKTASKIPEATFAALPALNHAAAFMRSDMVVPNVRQFLGKLSMVNKE